METKASTALADPKNSAESVTPSSAKPTVDIHTLPRELSWLSFNERVLQEAADPNTPAIEKMRFLGIFSNNMDEFFRVRVADVRRRILLPSAASDVAEDEELMHGIQDKVAELNLQFDRLYKRVQKDLLGSDISILPSHHKLTAVQAQWLRNYFRDEIRPYVCPILIRKDIDLADQLSDDDFYLAVEIKNGDSASYALIEVPTKETSRFILLPSSNGKQKQFILLDDALKFSLDDIFKPVFDYDSILAYSFKMTRDAELDISDEINQSTIDKLSEGLHRRLQAEPVRLGYDQDMPETMLKFLTRRLKLTNLDSLIPGSPYRNFRDFIGFPNVGRASLEHKPLATIPNQTFDSFDNALDAIAQRDVLLYYPYNSFGYFTELLRQSAFDPRVEQITINIYRVAKNSKVLSALCDAARNGKKVTVVVELRARFDERNNIEISKQLQSAGIRVAFGIPTLKIHSKLCLIRRKEDNKSKLYAHIGTGNFHEKNARIYTDYSYFTARPEITQEVAQVFDFIEYSYRPFEFKHLMVSPLNSRSKFEALVDQEIANATAGKKAYIHIKVNNLCDDKVAKALCQAANSGVEVNMIIRGMCTLQTEDRNISDKIEITSVIDRFLEHARVMIFGNDGDPAVYLTSADLMTRNIDHRVEVGVPIYDPALKQQIIDVYGLHRKDNAKARRINAKQSNPYVESTSKRKLRSQIAIHQYLSKIASQPAE